MLGVCEDFANAEHLASSIQHQEKKRLRATNVTRRQVQPMSGLGKRAPTTLLYLYMFLIPLPS